MHIVRFFKSYHSETSDGTLNFSKNMDLTLQTFICGQRFLNNCMAEFNQTSHNYYIEGVVDNIVRFLKADHSAPSGGTLNFSKNTDFGTSDFHLCGRRFLNNCTAEFNQTSHNYYMEGVVDARCSIFKIGSFSSLWWNTEL